jgi:HPt (histidine-containing phosphotransfer) domain-containing protein
MRRLVGIYFHETALELDLLQRAVEAKDAAEIRRIAHGSAGASAVYGMKPIAVLFRAMEYLGRDNALADTPRLMADAKAAFENIKLFWKSYVDGRSGQKAA